MPKRERVDADGFPPSQGTHMMVCRKWDCEQDDELLPFAAGAFLMFAPMLFTVQRERDLTVVIGT